MSEEKISLSVVIHTKNSAQTLQKCLDSVAFAKEVIVIDMESIDDTQKIVEKNSALFVSVKDEGYGYADPVRNFGLSKATQEWILVVDSDEQVSSGLKQWIIHFLNEVAQKDSTSAFRVPRRNFIFGREIQHTGWWPDYQIRFFKKDTVKWPIKVHGVPEVVGEIRDLPSDPQLALVHDNYPTVEKFIDRMNRYTSATAKEKFKTEPKTDFSGKSMVNAFSQEFNRRMFEWQGIKDGGIGVALAFLQSTYELLVELKQWELNHFSADHDESELTIKTLSTFSKELQYWIADWHVKNSTGLTQIIWRIRRKLL